MHAKPRSPENYTLATIVFYSTSLLAESLSNQLCEILSL